ncbi:MAG: SIS domain-containing protein [Patescibacteria group bacterium]
MTFGDNPLRRLAEAHAAERAELGTEFTPCEIWHQTEYWADSAARAADVLAGSGAAIGGLLDDPAARLVLTGAGSSYFIACCLAQAVGAAAGRPAIAVESTEIVTHPEILAGPGPVLLVSLARSGDSPESLGVYSLAKRLLPRLLQIVVTCNEEGALARAAAADGHPRVVLDPATNDRGLAMTASFTNLFLAGLALAHRDRLAEYRETAAGLAAVGRQLLETAPGLLAGLVERGFGRVIYLGGGPLRGAAQEGALKMLEMTDGAIPTLAHSYLGIRHGPLSFADERTLIVAMRSGDPFVRKYEDDLLAQLGARGLGSMLVALEPGPAQSGRNLGRLLSLYEGGTPLPDAWLPALAVPVVQVLALFASLSLGCRPDRPSSKGLISRVVEGVVIHDRESGREDRS